MKRAMEKPQVPGPGDSLGTAPRYALRCPQAAPRPLGQRYALPTPAWTTLRVAHFTTAPTATKREIDPDRNPIEINQAKTGNFNCRQPVILIDVDHH